MSDAEPTSLSRLHDIVTAPPAPWWPPAPGWYAVAAMALLLAVWGGWRWLGHARANAYRREALAELAVLARAMKHPRRRAAALPELALLVRRTALSAFPREEVAPLAGEAWLTFLDRTGGRSDFIRGVGRRLAELPYARAGTNEPNPEALLAVVRRWLRGHRPC